MRYLRAPSSSAAFILCLGLFGCDGDSMSSSQDAAVDSYFGQPSPDTGSTVTTPDTGLVAESDAGTALGDAAESEGGIPARDGGVEAGPAPLVIRGIVVAHSDYQSSAVSLLDRDGNVVKDGCINSGTGGSGLIMTFSGDLALPSQIAATSAITLIDRGNHTLTWIDPATCAPLRQLAVGTGFKSNPHDYVEITATKAYVPRYAKNAAATPAAGDFDDGNDLLIVDPSQPKILGRIDLTPFAPAGVLPRADRAMLVDGRVYVSLNASDAKFGSNATGRLLIVDPALDQVVGAVDLPGSKNCGAMAYVAAAKKLLVACTGDYGDTNQAAGSAIVSLNLGVNPPVVVDQVSAASVGGLIFSNATVAALDSQSALAVTMGDFSNTPPDKLWLLPQDGATPSKIFDSTEAYSLGAVLVDAERGRVFLTEGTTVAVPLVRVFDRVGGVLQATTSIKTNPTQKLPARALAWF